MKNDYAFVNSSSLALVFCLIFMNCSESALEIGKDETPGEWMYQQRAFPFDSLNRGVMQEAIVQTKAAQTASRNQVEPWTSIGPTNVGGRITDLALHPTDTNVIYVGASVGGVWRSEDKGETWDNIFEEPGALSIGNIAIAPSNPEVLYLGTGEANASATSGAFYGNGIYKSDDGGNSWEHKGLIESNHIGRIVVDPTNEDRVFVAVAGQLYGASDERGVYRSYDGGDTWKRVLFVTDSTACIDLVINPDNPNTLFAATWERRRYSQGRVYAGVTSRVYRSYDGGDSWEHLSNGLPGGDDFGRIGIAMAPSDTNRVYAVMTTDPATNEFHGLFRSDDAGDSWQDVDDGSIDGIFSSFGWFFGNVRVHPQKSGEVYLLGLRTYRSINGGVSWERHDRNSSVHVDQHAFEIHPLNPDVQVMGNDGGVYIGERVGGEILWKHVQGLPISQFYACEVDPQDEHRVMGGLQDNGTQLTSGAPDGWEHIYFGDGFRSIIHPTVSNILYAEYQWGRLARSDDSGQSWTSSTDGVYNDDRNNWNTPYIMDPNDPNVMYYGTQRLYRSVDGALNWYAISEDLTDPIINGSDEGTLSTIAASKSDPDVIYIGTDDGNVQKTEDGGASWKLVSDDLPSRYITSVAIDDNNAQRVYVTISGYRNLDYMPHVFFTEDGGNTWLDISGNLPEIPVNDIIIDPEIAQTLYIANDLGVWYTENQGVSWNILGSDLPATVVNDLVYHPESRTLTAATFGRSIFRYELGTPSSLNFAGSDEMVTLHAYPNPTSGEVRIEYPATAEGVELLVFDQMGRRMQVEVRPDGSGAAGSSQLDFSFLPEGLYTIVATSEGKNIGSAKVTRIQ